MTSKLSFVFNIFFASSLRPISTFVFYFSASKWEVCCLKGKISFTWDKESRLTIQALGGGRLVEFLLGRKKDPG